MTQEEIQQAYRSGEWLCRVPPVPTARWGEEDWIKWIGKPELSRVYRKIEEETP